MRIVAAGVAIGSGLLVLSGYFVSNQFWLEIRLELLKWAFIMAAVAVLVGISNLFGVHWQKIHKREKGGAYSVLLIVSLFASFVLGLVPPGTNNAISRFFLNAVIVPVETTLMALLAVTLVYASARILRRRVDAMTIIFLGFAVTALLAATPLPFGSLPFISDLISWFTYVVAAAGSRGILIGIALGALTTGLRVLFAIDRPYGGK